MRIKLVVDLDGDGQQTTMIANLWVACQWEQNENRRLNDGKPFGFTEQVQLAYYCYKLRGDQLPPTAKDWHDQHKNLDIVEFVNIENPNPTALAVTDGN